MDSRSFGVLMVLASFALTLASTWGLERIKRKRLQAVIDAAMPTYLAAEAMSLIVADTSTAKRRARKEKNKVIREVARKQVLIARTFSDLNLFSCVAASIPAWIGLMSLNSGQPGQAQDLTFLALAITIISKGGLLLLVLVIKPALASVPSVLTGIIVKDAYERWKKRKSGTGAAS